MNSMKCAFRVSVGKFLGFLVHHKGISVDPAKAMAIATMKRPTTTRELKSFLGRASYIRRFVPGLASVTSGLSKLLKKGTEFTWGAEQQEAFRRIQQIMNCLPTLQAPVRGRPLLLYLASNSQAIGALLAQEDDDGNEQPIYYVSRTLKDVETRKDSAMVGFTLSVQHRYQDPQGCQKSSHSKPASPVPRECSLSEEIPREVAVIELPGKKWTMRFNGSATATSNGLGIVLTCEDGDTLPLSFKLRFSCSNNAAKYEAYLTRLTIAIAIGVKHMRVLGDSNLVVSQVKGNFALREQSLAAYRTWAQRLEQEFQTFSIKYTQRSENRFADALATLGSQMSVKGKNTLIRVSKQEHSIIEVLRRMFSEELEQQD
ncbi:uncharacterized protein LOC142606246 [Castanea sativa]|uniref:uncharacterized protein LOC142606246 n=1 Tax=Castanea sativa TaxID=21020 RepID=UPI003F64BA22